MAESQSLTVLSPEADANCLPSGENTTSRTVSECPSRVCNKELQSSSTVPGRLLIHSGIWAKCCSLTRLLSGAKIRAEQYSWSGACSMIGLFASTKRVASWRIAFRREVLGAYADSIGSQLVACYFAPKNTVLLPTVT